MRILPETVYFAFCEAPLIIEKLPPPPAIPCLFNFMPTRYTKNTFPFTQFNLPLVNTDFGAGSQISFSY